MIEKLLNTKKGQLPSDHPEVLELRSNLEILLDKFPNGEHPVSDVASSIYSPLNQETRSIRLVSIEKGSQDSALRANLLQVSLDNPLSYEALSYIWGGKSNPGLLKLNGHEMTITSNLQDALMQLRSETQDRLLWVDAICIYSDRSSIKHLRNLRLGASIF